MKKDGISMKTFLEAVQICDSAFPIGTFNHSFGMENYLHRRVIRKAEDFQVWIRNYFRSQYRYGEGLLTVLCYRALSQQISGEQEQTQECVCRPVLDRILYYDDVITKSTLARETRDGTRMIAQQMCRLIQKMYGSEILYLTEYAQKMEQDQAYGNPAIVFSMFACKKGIAAADAFEMYGYSVASTLVQNAVRSIPIGQREGQVIFKEIIELICSMYEEVSHLPEEYLGANAPGLELAQILHETQPTRLFMS